MNGVPHDKIMQTENETPAPESPEIRKLPRDRHLSLVSHSDAALLTKMLGDEANEIASWHDANRNEIPRMVQQACRNEMTKLRTLADKLKALLPDCPECGARLERYDDQSFECPEECGFFHRDFLANS
jgi:hypothetical protein